MRDSARIIIRPDGRQRRARTYWSSGAIIDQPLDPLRWGLIPCWCKDPTGKSQATNAGCETVHHLADVQDAYGDGAAFSQSMAS